MKKLILPLLAILFIMACTQESSDGIVPADGAIKVRSSGGKVDVCHNGHVIHVNVNALPDHLAHGDAVDSDGDGFFSGENSCGLPVDCNDEDPDVTESCCPQGSWCGVSHDLRGDIHFQEDCDVIGHYVPRGSSTGCYATFTWEYLGSNGNVYTYHVDDICDYHDCTVTVIDNGTSLQVIYDCGFDHFNLFNMIMTPCLE